MAKWAPMETGLPDLANPDDVQGALPLSRRISIARDPRARSWTAHVRPPGGPYSLLSNQSGKLVRETPKFESATLETVLPDGLGAPHYVKLFSALLRDTQGRDEDVIRFLIPVLLQFEPGRYRASYTTLPHQSIPLPSLLPLLLPWPPGRPERARRGAPMHLTPEGLERAVQNRRDHKTPLALLLRLGVSGRRALVLDGHHKIEAARRTREPLDVLLIERLRRLRR